ncbi:hypothetical protein QYF36_010029 [Acer negundo]|nr:hypothetical protein QYF36_010029 [Acer negundo]
MLGKLATNFRLQNPHNGQVVLNSAFHVAVDGEWKLCPEAGGPVQFPGFNGDQLICPAYHELRSTSTISVFGQCLNSCNFNGDCVDGRCQCFLGFHGHDCSKSELLHPFLYSVVCVHDMTCVESSKILGYRVCCLRRTSSFYGGVCDNGVCEFRCSDYASYTCQNSSKLVSSLSVCHDVLKKDVSGKQCAPSILQQLEEVVVKPNYHRLYPSARKLFDIFGGSYCDGAAKRLACWTRPSSAVKKKVHEDQCTGANEIKLSWVDQFRWLKAAKWSVAGD